MSRPPIYVALACVFAACMSDNDKGGSGGMNGGGGPPTGPGPVVTTGTISGTVSAGSSGVAGAQVALGSAATATTAASGDYSFASVPSGTHSLTLTSPAGFALATGEPATKSTSVVANQTSTVNWSLVQLPPPPPPPKTIDVSLDASSFRPKDVTVARGDTVRWVNAQPIAHTITPDDRRMPGTWPAQNIPARAGSTFSHTFELSGIYTYNCTIHIGMSGVIRVP